MSKRSLLSRVLLALAAGAFALAGCTSTLEKKSALPPAPGKLHPTLERQVMVGYQGWFRTPGDGSDLGWTHYRQNRSRKFEAGHVGIDFWPDVSELAADEKFPTPLLHADGTVAQLFSSHHPRTVERHFRWMRDYGIDGAFVQRFSNPIIFDNAPSRVRLRAVDNVLGYARAAAEETGRSLVVMYDLSGMPKGAIARVKQDWRHLIDDLKIRTSPAYQFHRGKPLVAVWGIGFNDGRAYTLDEAADLVAFLKHDPVYGGNTVMLGIPTRWREQIGDAVPDTQLHAILQQADILSPWTPGRYVDLGGARLHAERLWIPDRAWCAERGLDYMPVVFPGFSWRNLKGVDNSIDRVDGRFLWEQYRQLVNSGFTMIYQAMFDEMDEGTQIFKTTNTPPAGTFFVTYAPMPSDYYLWLVGTAGRFWREGRTMPERIVDRPGQPEIGRYLRRTDEAIYAQAAQTHETLRGPLQISDALRRHAPEWAPLDGNRGRIRVSGKWSPTFLSSGDPTATVTWEIPVTIAGTYRLGIRYPADSNQNHATAARVRVFEGDALRREFPVNLRIETLHWIELGDVSLSAGGPCRVILDQPAKSGQLTIFEARLAQGR